MATLRLEIVTPEATAYSEDVEMVTLPGSEGELGIYPQHIPVLTTLKPGELRIQKDGQTTSMAVGEGFVEITGESVSILTDMEHDRCTHWLVSWRVRVYALVVCAGRLEAGCLAVGCSGSCCCFAICD